MYTIRRNGQEKEMHCESTNVENLLEMLKDAAYLSGRADLLKNGQCVYTAVKENELEVKIIKH